jgi:hypothetical protein
LDNSDDVAASIDVFNISISPSVDDVEVRFQVRMTELDIQALIDEGKARYSFRWSCSSTIANGELGVSVQMQHADSTGYVGWIDQELIRRTVRVDVKVIATVPIDRYQLVTQHPDYGEAAFSIMPGDVLVDGGYFEFEPNKSYDPLKPPVGSCFHFAANNKLKKGLQVQFHFDDHVLVAFPPDVLAGFGMLKERPDLQISLVVLPALMETLTFIKENKIAEEHGNGEDLTGRKWYGPISRLVEEVGSFNESSFTLAQKILGKPLDLSLTTPLQEGN